MSDAGAELSLSLWGRIADGVDKLNRKRWLAQPEAILAPVTAQASSASSGDLIFVLGDGPQMGRRWYVREIVVGGTLATSAAGGTAFILVGAAAPPVASVPLGMVRDFTLSTNALPQNAFYGRGEFVIEAQDNLWIMIHSPTASTQYTATAWIEDVELGTGTQAP